MSNMQGKQTIMSLREKFCSQSDKTPNEKRFTIDGVLDETTYYPFCNQYPNKYNQKLIQLPIYCGNESTLVDEDWFMGRLTDTQCEYAIKYLQVEPARKFITKGYTSVMFVNPFYYLLNSEYPIDKNLDAFNKIAHILIENYDNYVDLIRNLTYTKNQMHLMEYFYTYLPIDESKVCSICLHSEPVGNLVNCCDCKNPSHANCLEKFNNVRPLEKCNVCKSKYKINEPVHRTLSGIAIKATQDKTLFFPFDDMYYEPLMTLQPIRKYTGMSRLTMAIMYLQVERVEQLLQENEVLDNLSNYYFGYPGYMQTPIIALCTGNLPSNTHITFGNNRVKYVIIAKELLKTGKINLDAEDAFGKTAHNYIDKLDLYSICLFKTLFKWYEANFKTDVSK